jgi:hypothetical protein
MSGFDGTVMSSVNSMKQYQAYFGLKSAEAKTGVVFVCRPCLHQASAECTGYLHRWSSAGLFPGILSPRQGRPSMVHADRQCCFDVRASSSLGSTN